MVKYFNLLSFLLVISSGKLFGQQIPSIQLDRPDQTECPFITPKHFVQIENGFTIENADNNHRTYSYPSTLWKYGVSQNFEFRLITELIDEKNNGNRVAGITPITVGFKTALFEEKGFIPKTSFIGHINTAKIGSKALHESKILPSFRFTMQNTLSPKITLGYNLGAEWTNENTEYIYTITTGFSLTDKIGCYAELYGFFPNDNSGNHRFDGGLTYLFNDNFIMDISGGVGLTKNTPKNYISLGISYRFNTRK